MSSSGVRSSLPVNSKVAPASTVGDAGVAVSSVSGARPTVHSCTAGVGSTTPNERFARTSKRCEPSVSPPTKCGEPQLCHSEPSSAHSKVTPAVLEEKVKVALESAVGEAGAESSVVFGGGGGATIVQVWTAGVWSTLPARSVARTRSVCWASDRPVSSCGDSQAAKAAPSSEHWKLAPGSSLENSKVALDSSVSESGPESIEVSGAVTSCTFQACVAGDWTTLPAVSIARIRIVYSPGSRPWTSCGEEQLSYAAPFSEHSKPSSSAPVTLSVPVNSKAASGDPVPAGGATVICVCGGGAGRGAIAARPRE